MSDKHPSRQVFLEIALVVVSLALTCLLYRVNGFKMVVLNLFYLPIVLAAFFLGRYRAGVLALFCVVSASVVTAIDLHNFAAYSSPITIGLALTIWGAVLGLNAILVGTLSDERANKIEELHDAYVGVVEVLSRYLSSADPRLKDRAARVAQLSERVASRMRLPDKDIDDIRVAALLQDIEDIEITAKVIRRALGDLSADDPRGATTHRFHGSDLVHSLGTVLTGALPLLADHTECLRLDAASDDEPNRSSVPFGVEIIRTVRRFDAMVHEDAVPKSVQEAIDALREDLEAEHHPAVLHALEQATRNSVDAATDSVSLQAPSAAPV